jgi:hypothetical protein
MQSVTLYGKGALSLQHDREVIRSSDGQIVVPSNLVDAVIAAGWSRTPPDSVLSETSDVAVLQDGNAETGEPPVRVPLQLVEDETVKLEKIDVAAIEGGKQIEGAEPSVEDTVDALESGAPELVDGPFAGIEATGAGDELTKAVANPDDVKLNEYIAALTAGFSADEAKALVWPDGDAPAVLPTLTAGE